MLNFREVMKIETQAFKDRIHYTTIARNGLTRKGQPILGSLFQQN